jgi:hypothetical protein
MCLGSLVDLGVPLAYLTESLDRLGIAGEYKLWSEDVQRQGQRATKLHVELGHHHDHDHYHPAHRHLPDIERMILDAALPTRVEQWSLAIFRQLAIAEGAVHGLPPEQVHFHEVGAVDAIVDVVGTCLGLDWLKIDQIYCSALPTGGGMIRAAHGQLPVPVPAVLKLWEMRQVPVYSNGIERELVTPTGAAIVTTLASQFGAAPPMTLEKIGLGAGSLDLPIPNMVRLWIGTQAETAQTITLLETQVDDLNPQAIGYVFEALLAVGALDVFTQAIGMKKSRPGILLSVICLPEQASTCEAILFRETTTLGIRRSTQARSVLEREIHNVETPHGTVRIKIASRQGDVLNVQPEYEDCAAIARSSQLPWREIHRLALQAWYARPKQSVQ